MGRKQTKFSGNRQGITCNQEEWLEEFLDNKDRFQYGSESDDSDNDDEIYKENNEQQQRYLRVLPIIATK